MSLNMPLAPGGHPVPVLSLGTVQTVAVGAASVATSNAVGATTEVVRVVSDTDCHVHVDTAPVATTSLTYLPADTPEFFQVVPGLSKLAFIQNAASGTAYVTEMS